MNIDVELGLGSIPIEVSRIDGLYSKWAQKHGIPYVVVQVYYILRLHSAITQKKITEIWEIPKQTVNNVIKQLKAKNHIILVSGNGDKREKIIQLTPLGETYSTELLKPFFELNETVINRVGMDLLHNLLKGLNTIKDALEMEMELREVSSKWENKTKNQILVKKNV
jgi:DNA-binding MarR family transcriptional regulator